MTTPKDYPHGLRPLATAQELANANFAEEYPDLGLFLGKTDLKKQSDAFLAASAAVVKKVQASRTDFEAICKRLGVEGKKIEARERILADTRFLLQAVFAKIKETNANFSGVDFEEFLKLSLIT